MVTNSESWSCSSKHF